MSEKANRSVPLFFRHPIVLPHYACLFNFTFDNVSNVTVMNDGRLFFWQLLEENLICSLFLGVLLFFFKHLFLFDFIYTILANLICLKAKKYLDFISFSINESMITQNDWLECWRFPNIKYWMVIQQQTTNNNNNKKWVLYPPFVLDP